MSPPEPNRRRRGDDSAIPHRRRTDPEHVMRLHKRVDDHAAWLAEILKWKSEEQSFRVDNAREHQRVLAALKILTETVQANTDALSDLAGLRQVVHDMGGVGRALDGLNMWLRRITPLVGVLAALSFLWVLVTGVLNV